MSVGMILIYDIDCTLIVIVKVVRNDSKTIKNYHLNIGEIVKCMIYNHLCFHITTSR